MSSKNEAFSNAVSQYLTYTKMPWGKLFYLTAWNQIDSHLESFENSILDIGCGFGITSLEYSRRGCHVTGIEPTPEMLRVAQEDAEREGLTTTFINADFQSASRLADHYDTIYCHNILEYVEDPRVFIKRIGDKQNEHGMLSLIAHNPAAKILKKAIVNKDPEEALASIGNAREYSSIIQTDLTVYSIDEIKKWLRECGYEVQNTYGIHNVYGYIIDNEIKQDEAWNDKIVKLEMELGKLHPFKDIALFTHYIATKRR